LNRLQVSNSFGFWLKDLDIYLIIKDESRFVPVSGYDL
jgi:hypothetical protein